MSLTNVKVATKQVLQIVQENKEKHDAVLKGAIEGYWLEAESYLKQNEKDQLAEINKNHKENLKRLRKSKKDAMKALKSATKADLEKVKARERNKGFRYWTRSYPEDHGDDYLGTIRRLELSVEPELVLDTHEFDAYIRNKWEWRNSFLNNNSGYVSYALTSSYALGSYPISASWSVCSISSSWCSGSWCTGSLSSSYVAMNNF